MVRVGLSLKNCHLHPGQIEALLSCEELRNGIVYLDVAQNNLTWPALRSRPLLSILATQVPQLRILNLSGCHLTASGVNELVEHLELSRSALESLSLASTFVGEAVESIARFLCSPDCRLLRLDLSYNQLQPHLLAVLLKGLGGAAGVGKGKGGGRGTLSERESLLRGVGIALRELKLVRCGIGDVGMEVLSNADSSHWQLKALDLSRNSIGTPGMPSLSRFVSSPWATLILESLSLSHNDLSDPQNLLGECLERYPPDGSLRVLSLRNTRLSFDPLVASRRPTVLRALRHCLQSVESVDISGHQFDQHRLRVAARLLGQMQSVSFGAHSHGDLFADALRCFVLSASPDFSRLRALDLSESNLSDAGLRLLCGALSEAFTRLPEPAFAPPTGLAALADAGETGVNGGSRTPFRMFGATDGETGSNEGDGRAPDASPFATGKTPSTTAGEGKREGPGGGGAFGVFAEAFLRASALMSAGLERLNLRGNGISQTGVRYLLDFLKANRGLQFLDLSNNPLRKGGGDLLARFLWKEARRSGRESVSVSINRGGWTEEGGGVLEDEELPSLGLQTLRLASCQLTGVGATAIFLSAKALGLRSLDISDNALDPQNAKNVLGMDAQGAAALCGDPEACPPFPLSSPSAGSPRQSQGGGGVAVSLSPTKRLPGSGWVRETVVAASSSPGQFASPGRIGMETKSPTARALERSRKARLRSSTSAAKDIEGSVPATFGGGRWRDSLEKKSTEKRARWKEKLERLRRERLKNSIRNRIQMQAGDLGEVWDGDPVVSSGRLESRLRARRRFGFASLSVSGNPLKLGGVLDILSAGSDHSERLLLSGLGGGGSGGTDRDRVEASMEGNSWRFERLGIRGMRLEAVDLLTLLRLLSSGHRRRVELRKSRRMEGLLSVEGERGEKRCTGRRKKEGREQGEDIGSPHSPVSDQSDRGGGGLQSSDSAASSALLCPPGEERERGVLEIREATLKSQQPFASSGMDSRAFLAGQTLDVPSLAASLCRAAASVPSLAIGASASPVIGEKPLTFGLGVQEGGLADVPDTRTCRQMLSEARGVRWRGGGVVPGSADEIAESVVLDFGLNSLAGAQWEGIERALAAFPASSLLTLLLDGCTPPASLHLSPRPTVSVPNPFPTASLSMGTTAGDALTSHSLFIPAKSPQPVTVPASEGVLTAAVLLSAKKGKDARDGDARTEEKAPKLQAESLQRQAITEEAVTVDLATESRTGKRKVFKANEGLQTSSPRFLPPPPVSLSPSPPPDSHYIQKAPTEPPLTARVLGSAAAVSTPRGLPKRVASPRLSSKRDTEGGEGRRPEPHRAYRTSYADRLWLKSGGQKKTSEPPPLSLSAEAHSLKKGEKEKAGPRRLIVSGTLEVRNEDWSGRGKTQWVEMLYGNEENQKSSMGAIPLNPPASSKGHSVARLKVLRLVSCRLGDRDLQALVSALLQPPSTPLLHTVDLTDNRLSPACVPAIRRLLQAGLRSYSVTVPADAPRGGRLASSVSPCGQSQTPSSLLCGRLEAQLGPSASSRGCMLEPSALVGVSRNWRSGVGGVSASSSSGRRRPALEKLIAENSRTPSQHQAAVRIPVRLLILDGNALRPLGIDRLSEAAVSLATTFSSASSVREGRRQRRTAAAVEETEMTSSRNGACGAFDSVTVDRGTRDRGGARVLSVTRIRTRRAESGGAVQGGRLDGADREAVPPLSLCELSVRACGLEHPSGFLLGRMVESPFFPLTSLNVSDNVLGLRGLASLLQAASRPLCRLRMLDVSSCVGGKGVCALILDCLSGMLQLQATQQQNQLGNLRRERVEVTESGGEARRRREGGRGFHNARLVIVSRDFSFFASPEEMQAARVFEEEQRLLGLEKLSGGGRAGHCEEEEIEMY
uniref:Uncharacterized protein n=1 Tax=Chromera velia CCMP2878 TaxID=1169474 RepID=A0A0G4G183_9ALVE|eukprot:Cvel_4052.t1-p1 / transcript=Cvel_4052.t1 / gene=Cvel_4052 / organism=Chromera_velia_CCMP2878 / gene_product=hypothetical protein / transcript_product=hypothetical protein / location=Cvel_scaffold172:83947-96106(-) / protein_length=1881 / sequence_SO=supercontig / SO=protein_coding / is_pseudo=false